MTQQIEAYQRDQIIEYLSWELAQPMPTETP